MCNMHSCSTARPRAPRSPKENAAHPARAGLVDGADASAKDQNAKFALAGALAETATVADFETPPDVALIV